MQRVTDNCRITCSPDWHNADCHHGDTRRRERDINNLRSWNNFTPLSVRLDKANDSSFNATSRSRERPKVISKSRIDVSCRINKIVTEKLERIKVILPSITWTFIKKQAGRGAFSLARCSRSITRAMKNREEKLTEETVALELHPTTRCTPGYRLRLSFLVALRATEMEIRLAQMILFVFAISR